jgi:ABC-type multidrug transport system ATPase subunit
MVVGRPGSGCTTALKVIANMREEYLAMEGNVWYGSFDAMTAKNIRPDQVAFVGTVSPIYIQNCCTFWEY